MAIGTALAILGSAAIGAGASAYGASKASKAAKQAAEMSNQLARETRDQIAGYVSPYLPGAYAANDALYGMLGLSGGSGGGNLLSGDGKDWNAYLEQNPDIKQRMEEGVSEGAFGPGKQWATPLDWVKWHNQTQGEGRPVPDAAPADQTGQGAIYGPPVAPAPTFGPRNMLARPEFGPAPALPNINPEDYRQSDYAKFILDQGNRNMRAGAAAGGFGQSGAALKEAIKFGQGVAGDDYQQWVGNLLGLYDRKANQFNTDRSFANQNYDVDTTRADARYDADRAFDYSKWLDQRNYDTNRFDTKVGNLFNLSNQGLSAAGTLAGNATNYANMVSNNNNSAASATGNAAIAGANSVNNLLGQGLQGLGYFYGNKGSQPSTLPFAANDPYGSASFDQYAWAR